MLLSNWLVALRNRPHSRRRSRARRLTTPAVCERLEQRLLLSVFAGDDSYSLKHDTTLNQSAPGVLSNDFSYMGGTLSAVLVSGPSHADFFELYSDGSFTYTPTEDYIGGDSFIYYATNGSSNSSNTTVTLTVTNSAPTAWADNYTVSIDELDTAAASLSSVLANDTDPNSDPLTAVLVTNASHGTVMLNSNGHFVYTPDLGYFGQDSFTYKADDGPAESAATTVNIEVKKTFGNRTNLDDRPSAAPSDMGDFAVSYHTGDTVLTHAVAPGHALHYSALTHEDPSSTSRRRWG